MPLGSLEIHHVIPKNTHYTLFKRSSHLVIMGLIDREANFLLLLPLSPHRLLGLVGGAFFFHPPWFAKTVSSPNSKPVLFSLSIKFDAVSQKIVTQGQAFNKITGKVEEGDKGCLEVVGRRRISDRPVLTDWGHPALASTSPSSGLGGAFLWHSFFLFRYSLISKVRNRFSWSTLAIWEIILRSGKRGRPKKPRVVIDPELQYATVHKTRDNGKVVKESKELLRWQLILSNIFGRSVKSWPIQWVNNNQVTLPNLLMCSD